MESKRGSKSEPCLIDSNVWIAFYNENDSTHAQAIAVMMQLEQAQAAIFVSNFIFQETWTLLRLSQQPEKATRFVQAITHTQHIQQFDIDQYWIRETIDFFHSINNRSKQSLTDFTNMFLSLTFGFTLVSFDKKMMSLYRRVKKEFK